MGGVRGVLDGGLLGVIGLPFWVVLLGAFVFVLGRCCLYYYLGRLAARGAERSRLAAVMRSERFGRVVAAVDRYGVLAVAVALVLPGTTTAAIVAAGVLGMDRVRFLVGIVLGGVPWALTRVAVGVAVIDGLYYLGLWNPAVLVAVAVVLAVVIGGVLVARRRPARSGRGASG